VARSTKRLSRQKLIGAGISLLALAIGFGMNMVARGDYGWSLGLGVGTSGGEVGSKVQARWSK